MNDPNMDTALQWADQLGPPCELPLSLLLSVDKRAILVNVINNNLAPAGDLLNMLSNEEKERRLRVIAGASKEFLPDMVDESARLNLCLRLWSGCLMAAKTIATHTLSGPNVPDSRERIFSYKIDRIAANDPTYLAGVEAAAAFKRLKSEKYSFNGVPRNSPVRRYG